MYYSVTGTVLHAEPYLAVIGCCGVGYKCMTTLTTLSCLPPVGGEATLYTHLNVREDALDLYGFYTQAELNAFKMLIGVSGVGPKSALAILSDMTPDKLALCIAAGDSKSLRAAPGIGPKAAQRIILECKDRIGTSELSGEMSEVASQLRHETTNMSEAASALAALGYSPTESAKALAGLAVDMPVEDMIKHGLKVLSGGR